MQDQDNLASRNTCRDTSNVNSGSVLCLKPHQQWYCITCEIIPAFQSKIWEGVGKPWCKANGSGTISF